MHAFMYVCMYVPVINVNIGYNPMPPNLDTPLVSPSEGRENE